MDQQLVELEIGVAGRAAYPDILYSGGIGPCITVGLWHPSQRAGYMIHDHSLESTLPALLSGLEKEGKKLSTMHACVVGASLYVDLPDTREEMQKLLQGNKDFVERTLGSKFPKKNLQFHWLEPHYEAELYLDTGLGKFLLKVYDSLGSPNEAVEQALDFNPRKR